MANNFNVKDASGTQVTFVSYDTGSGVQLSEFCLHDGTNKMTQLYDVGTNAAHEYVPGVNLRIKTNAGSVEAKGQKTMSGSIPVVFPSDQLTNSNPGYFVPQDAGGNITPAGDAPAHARYVRPTDGTYSLSLGYQTLFGSTNINANGTGTAMTGLGFTKDLVALIGCTATPTGGAPTLDVYLQHSPDGGTTWQDIAHTQFTTATANRLIAINGSQTGGTGPITLKDGTLSGETVVQGPWGDQLRLKWIFAAGGSSGSYTLQASIVLK
jgi:hypothetical protein